eukprot:EC793118.1.p1 GENE.EC793118.1~~EC793118.1.p1  ORF type:complete len:152 (+),score=28.29 EC793118.1:110-565(+)
METVNTNPNTGWIQDKLVWTLYVAAILAFRVILDVFGLKGEVGWTITNVAHSLLTLLFLHWIKGMPFEDVHVDQGRYNRLTFWEQIDSQRQFTPTRKFLTAVPVVLLLWAVSAISDETNMLIWVNVIASVVVLIAKMPALHKVRIFGINRY